MKIKDLEALTGIPRATIRFYEKEGLLSPVRQENGYREYSEEDIEKLQKIKLLRLLALPVEDIRRLLEGKQDMVPMLKAHLQTLQQEESGLQDSRRVCQEICNDHVRFDTLDTSKYIASYQKSYGKTAEKTETLYQQDTMPRVTFPIRRFLARTLDLSVYNTFLCVFFVLVCNVNLMRISGFTMYLITLCDLGLMLLIEPLLLRLFGTTLGKWILGLFVLDGEGNHLTYRDAFDRTKRVLWFGMGLYLPVVSLVLLWKRMKACNEGEILPWEPDSVLELKDEKNWRGWAWAGANVLLFVLIFLAASQASMPRHRGAVSIADFSENYNRLAAYEKVDLDAFLDQNGQWVKGLQDGTVIYVGEEYVLPVYEYTIEDGEVRSVCFHYETASDWPSDCQNHMALAALSFACTDEDYGVFSKARRELLKEIQSHPYQPFSYRNGDVLTSCTVEHTGYRTFDGPQGMIYAEEGADHHYSVYFSITKE